MECVHSVLTDNAAFGASYEKGAVRILTAFRLHCFRALASVVSLPRSVWKLAPRPMRGFFLRGLICSSNRHAKPPRRETSRGKFGIRLGEIAYGLILTSRARLLTSRLAVARARRTRTSPPAIRQHHKFLTCGAIAQLDDVALRSALSELRSL